MAAPELKGKKVTLLGAGGRTGISLIRFLAGAGAEVTAYDAKPQAALAERLQPLRGLPFVLDAGNPEPGGLEKADLVLLSPGVPATAPYLARAKRQGVPVWSEIELAYRCLDAPLLAVTGTNGKSTATSLLGHLLTAWGKKAFAGGNLGTPLIEAAGKQFDFVAAEISSFQLEAVEEFRPAVGICLNISPNHLDRHGDMESYAALKGRLFARMEGADRAVLNGDDPRCRALARSIAAPVWFYGAKGASADLGVREGRIVLPGGGAVSLRNWSLPGRHNIENCLAAVGAAAAVGCPAGAMEEALGRFRGLPHRLEEVGTLDGVRYIDDSKSTTPDAAVRALEAVQAPLLLLAGGRPKGAGYGPVARAARGRAREVILFGEAAGAMREAFGEAPVRVAKNLAEAFALARSLARPGDTVLLSPANASFDEFADYEERGRRFAGLVKEAAGGGT